MAYIGRAPQYGAFYTQTITANSVDTTFALDYVAPTAASLLVSVGGVIQQPESAYIIVSGGTEIQFTEAPDSSLNVFITFLGEKYTVSTVGNDVITTAMIQDYTIESGKMANTGVTADTYGGSSQIPVITIDGAGRITAAANTSITLGTIATQDADSVAITGGTITGLTNLTGANATFTGIVSAADFNSTSDITLKENILPIENPMSVLEKLQGISFDWKKDGTKSFGLSAQDVEKVLPEIVRSREDGYKGINYINIIAYLIEAVKELSGEIKQLKQK